MQIGRHTLQFEPPDILHTIYRGDVSPHEFVEMYGFVKDLAAERPYLLYLADVSELPIPSADVRRNTAEFDRTLRIHAWAFYGGTFATNTIVTLLGIAANLVSDKPVRCFESKADAYAWLVSLRKHLLAEEEMSK